MKIFLPAFFEISAAAVACDGSEGLTRYLIGGKRIAPSDSRKHFRLGQSVEQRRDQRLNRHERPIGGISITPRFEIMRRWQKPLRIATRRRNCCRLILVI